PLSSGVGPRGRGRPPATRCTYEHVLVGVRAGRGRVPPARRPAVPGPAPSALPRPDGSGRERRPRGRRWPHRRTPRPGRGCPEGCETSTTGETSGRAGRARTGRCGEACWSAPRCHVRRPPTPHRCCRHLPGLGGEVRSRGGAGAPRTANRCRCVRSRLGRTCHRNVGRASFEHLLNDRREVREEGPSVTSWSSQVKQAPPPAASPTKNSAAPVWTNRLSTPAPHTLHSGLSQALTWMSTTLPTSAVTGNSPV